MILFLIVLIKEKAKLSTFTFQLLEGENNLILCTEFRLICYWAAPLSNKNTTLFPFS